MAIRFYYMRRMAGLKPASRLVLAGVLAFAATSPGAEASVDWAFRGFGTFGAVGTATDKLVFRRDLLQSSGSSRGFALDTDSRLGLQVDGDFGKRFHATVQWVARNVSGNFPEQNLEWAFLAWRAADDLDLRVGRVGADAFLLADYRNVGYAYPWTRPPHEFYGPLIPYHLDGADIVKRLPMGEGYLAFKAFAGHNRTTVVLPAAPRHDLDMLAVGGNVSYEVGDWRARAAYAHIDVLSEVPPNPLLAPLGDPEVNAAWPGAYSYSKELSTKNKDLHYFSVGLAYDDGTWLAQAEGAYLRSALQLFPSLASGYASLGRRFGSVTLYTLGGIAQSVDRATATAPLVLADARMAALRDAVDGIRRGDYSDEKSVSLGVRWDALENIALKAQWSLYWLGRNGSLLWLKRTESSTPDTVNVWSFGVDFVF